MMSTRREFLATLGSSAVISLGAAAPPAFLLQAMAAAPSTSQETVLVVIQLSGGNDGLNTVVPYTDDAYRHSRPTLSVPVGQVLKINDALGFHPSLRGMADLVEAGQLATVQGVGYPNPNRSHFESMDIWHTCQRKGNPRTTGWLGRYLDASQARSTGDAPALHLGGEKQPLALAADQVRSPTIRSLDRFRLDDGGDPQWLTTVEDLVQGSRQGEDDLLSFIQTSTAAALKAGRRVELARQEYQTPVDYPRTRLAENLRTAAQLIDAGLTTRVYYVELAGFDTHSRQAGAHTALLKDWSDSMAAFVQDVSHHGHANRVLVMAFSEFGRRVKENASAGTDHGAAAPVFLAGGKVNAGVHGDHPSLTDLQDGDLKHHTDFRQVYAAVLENWLGWPSRPVLGDVYAPIDVIA